MPSNQSTSPRPLGIYARLAAPFLVFLWFAGDLLRTYFSGDDYMNLHQYYEHGWSVCRGILLFWSSAYYRPFGGFVYLMLYRLFGFHALPFKVLAFALLLANLALALYVAKQLLRSPILAAFVGILFAYHARLAQLYYSFGTIYDITCFAFLYAALALFLRTRQRGDYPGPKLLAGLAVLQILALDCKEMAVVLPALVALYELIIPGRRELLKRTWAPAILGSLTLIYLIGKTHGAGALTHSDGYAPVFSLHKYAESTCYYFNQIFYLINAFHGRQGVLLLAAGALAALLLRSRLALLGWLWFAVAMLPLDFIPPRDGFVLYIPSLGFAIALVALYWDLYLLLKRFRIVALVLNPANAVFFIVLLFFVARRDRHEKRWADFVQRHQLDIDQKAAADLARETPHPQPHALLLFLNDPFATEGFTDIFLPSLMRHDLALNAARARLDYLATAPAILPLYSEIYDFKGGHLVRIPPASLSAYLRQLRSDEGFIDAVDGVWSAPAEEIWTKPEFHVRASCAAAAATCAAHFILLMPELAYPVGATHHLTVQEDGATVQNTSLTTGRPADITVRLAPGVPHLLGFTLDAMIPASQHPADPRDLGMVLRGAAIGP